MSNVGLSFEEGSAHVSDTVHRLTPGVTQSFDNLEAACR